MNSGFAAIGTYALLTVLWGLILVLYLRHRRHAKSDPLITMLLGVLAIDAFKSFVESSYFGLVWGANYGLLPEVLKSLGEPGPLTAVKLLNVAVACIVLIRLARFWVPTELDRRAAQRDEEAKLREELQKNLALAREAEERLSLAVSTTSDFVWDTDLRTGRVSGSPQVAAWLGYAPEEWPPKPWHVIVHPDDTKRVLDGVKAVIKGQTSRYDVKHRVVRKDGAVLHVHSTGTTTRDSTGRALRFVGAVRDITRDVQAEAGRVQAQKLESLGLLAGGIAHDFNNLLTVLSSSLDLADRKAQKGENATEALTMASLAVTRATVLTRQLLAYAGRGKLLQRPVDLNDLVGSMGQLLSVSIPRKVKLVKHLAEQLPGVQGDDGQLQQLVMNLITNAAEAIGDREGTVTLTTEALTVTAPPPGVVGEPALGPVVRLTVSDDGAGMSPELQSRIFDPFFSTKGSGRGLGLAALAGILRAHGGAIALESTPGKGTTFSIDLPALAAPVQSNRWSAKSGASAPLSCRVLLVDDEELLRRSASRLLKSLGCQVDEAETGKAAVEKVRAAPEGFDVVLMDLTMPEMDGAEASQVIATLAPKLPIILSSGYTTASTDFTGKHLFSLAKPYSVTALESVLREAMRSTAG